MKPLSAMISIVMEWGRLSYPNQFLVRITEKCTRRLHGIEPFFYVGQHVHKRTIYDILFGSKDFLTTVDRPCLSMLPRHKLMRYSSTNFLLKSDSVDVMSIIFARTSAFEKGHSG
jgi:hypothetical protein